MSEKVESIIINRNDVTKELWSILQLPMDKNVKFEEIAILKEKKLKHADKISHFLYILLILFEGALMLDFLTDGSINVLFFGDALVIFVVLFFTYIYFVVDKKQQSKITNIMTFEEQKAYNLEIVERIKKEELNIAGPITVFKNECPPILWKNLHLSLDELQTAKDIQKFKVDQSKYKSKLNNRIIYGYILFELLFLIFSFNTTIFNNLSNFTYGLIFITSIVFYFIITYLLYFFLIKRFFFNWKIPKEIIDS